MSTKITLDYGDNFHLYGDVFDENAIYLEVSGEEFSTSPNRICLRLPRDLWNRMRAHTIPPAADWQNPIIGHIHGETT